MSNEYIFELAESDETYEFGFEEPVIEFELEQSIEIVHADPYEGEYIVTPSSETQVLETIGLQCYDNITVNPIPSNYGLITWNGSTLTVS